MNTQTKEKEALGARVSRWDLLSLSLFRRFLTSPFYPGLFQGVSVFLLALVLFFAFMGTTRPAWNLASLAIWTLWWPLLPLSLILGGRAWCAICPVLPPMGLVQRLTRPSRIPGLNFRRYSIAFMGLSLLLLTWADGLWRFTGSPRVTGWLLMALLVLGMIMAALYKGRSFCRHGCPIGALTGLYAMTAVVELRGQGGSCLGCHQLCYRGYGGKDGCTLYEFPRTMDSNRYCNFCANCLKVCPQDNLGLRLRPPWRELGQLRRPLTAESLLAVLLIALVFMQTLYMTTIWGSYVKWMVERVGLGSYSQVLTITFLGAVLGIIGAYLLASWLSSRGGSWQRNLASYGYAFIPLALAGHLGHNMGHLLYEGPLALRIILSQLANLVGISYSIDYSGTSTPLFGMSWIAVLVALGGVFSLLLAWHQERIMAQRGQTSKAFPHLVLLAALGIMFTALFLSPMNPRHSH